MSSLFSSAAARIAMSPDSPYVSYTPDQAAVQITRDLDYWGTSLGQAVNVTFAFRAHDAAYDNGVTGFSEFNKGQIDAALLSFQSWSDVANISFTRAGSGDTGPTAYSDSAKILLGDYTAGADYAAAFTYLPDSTPDGGDVWVNSSLDYNAAPKLLNYGQMTLTHEIGHAIGLEHPGDYDASDSTAPTYQADAAYTEDTRQYSLMSYFSETNTGADFKGAYASAPMLDDIAAAQRLYGANMATRAGNTVYGFHSTADRPWYAATSSSSTLVFCIWDGGGRDTLDLSGYSTRNMIDLYAGEFSDVGGLTGNVSIAQGVVIEDAIGGSGVDSMAGNDYANVLRGGAGDDVIFGQGGDDTLDGGVGNDQLNGGDGFDTVSYAHATQAIDLEINGVRDGVETDDIQQIEKVVGTAFADRFVLAPGPGFVSSVSGGGGDDTFLGYWSPQYIDGGDGRDTLTYAADHQAVNISLAHATSIEVVIGSVFNDRLTGNGEANSIGGGRGDDTIEGGGGNDTLEGNLGVNVVSFAHYASGIRLDLTKDVATVGVDHLTVKQMYGAIGTAFGDVITTGADHGVLNAGSGDDIIQVRANQAGAAHAVSGGDGLDTLSFSGAKSAVSISLLGTHGEVVSGIEGLIGSAFADTLQGDSSANQLDGGEGDDTLIGGGGGADQLIGSGGMDTVTYNSLNHGVTVNLQTGIDNTGEALETIEDLIGTDYTDVLTGSISSNALSGGDGADTLIGGRGADTLIGGAANDQFVYTSIADSRTKGGIDVIADLQSTDTIDLSAIDADKKTAGDQAFRIVDHFDKHAAELVLSYDAVSGETRASMDVNGDGKADMVVRLSGDEHSYSHFVL